MLFPETRSHLSRILWYRRTLSGKLFPLELRLDAPVVLGGTNGSGKTTLLRLLPFLMGVRSIPSLHESEGLKGFREFYLEDNLLLAEFTDRHPRTYLFSDTSRGIRVLEFLVPIEGVRNEIDALLARKTNVSTVLSELEKTFMGRVSKMGYLEYAKIRSHQGGLLHTLLQERVSLKGVSETLGKFFDEKHFLTPRLRDLRESLRQRIGKAEDLRKVHELVRELPGLEEELEGLCRKAEEFVKAQRQLEELLRRGEALYRRLEGKVQEEAGRLQALQEKKASLGDREALEGEKKVVEERIIEIGVNRNVLRKTLWESMRPLEGEAWEPPATPQEARALAQDLRLELDGISEELNGVRERLALLRYMGVQEELRHLESQAKEVRERIKNLEGPLLELAGGRLSPFIPPDLDEAWWEAQDLLKGWYRLKGEEDLSELALLGAWEALLEPPPLAIRRYPELPSLLEAARRRGKVEEELYSLERWEAESRGRLASLQEGLRWKRQTLRDLQENLAHLGKREEVTRKELDRYLEELHHLEEPGTLLAYLKSLPVPDWTALARPLRTELFFRKDLNPRFLGEGGLVLDVERIEWKDPFLALKEEVQSLEARLEDLRAQREEEGRRAAALEEEIGRLGRKARELEESQAQRAERIAQLKEELPVLEKAQKDLERLHRKASSEADRAREKLERLNALRARLEELLPGLQEGLRRKLAGLEERLAELHAQKPLLEELKAKEKALEEKRSSLERAKEDLERWTNFLEEEAPKLDELLKRREESQARLEALRGLLREEEEAKRVLESLRDHQKDVGRMLEDLERYKSELEELRRPLWALLAEEGRMGSGLPEEAVSSRCSPNGEAAEDSGPEGFLEEAREVLGRLRRGLLQERFLLDEARKGYAGSKARLYDELSRVVEGVGLPAALSGLKEVAHEVLESMLKKHQLDAQETTLEEHYLNYKRALDELKETLHVRGVLPIELANFRFTSLKLNLEAEEEKVRSLERWIGEYLSAAEGVVREGPLPKVLERYKEEAGRLEARLEDLLRRGVMNEVWVVLEVEYKEPGGSWAKRSLGGGLRGSTSGGGDMITAIFLTALTLRILLRKEHAGFLIPLPIDEFGRLDRASSAFVLRDLHKKMGVLPVVAVPSVEAARQLARTARENRLKLRVYETREGFLREVQD